eukprot:NODE_5828_length_1730_cov_17.812227.p3 GENE.NODE_5828_length_1730_cov_17.812227~~NODE_5828_length_1730_cov_17.812227.p3  ORF type:complete len:173 (-),score=70.31 NODE_5828_length_1730_cov_17.812227:664-1182(-)
MKETRDATVFKDHVLGMLEQATYTPSLDSDARISKEEEARIKEVLTFVIVGDVFAVGDCAMIEGAPLAQTAQVADQEAAYVAKLLNEGDKIDAFKFHNKGMLAYVGGAHALAGKVPIIGKFTGRLGFFAWRSTYWFMQLSMRNRFMLATDWVRTMIFGRDLTRLGARSKIQD